MIPNILKSHVRLLHKHAKHHIKKVNRSNILVFSLILVTLIGGFASYLVIQNQSYKDSIYPNVYVDNKPVGGKNKADVIKMYAPVESKLHAATINVFYKDQQIATISGEQLSLKTNVKDIAEQAYIVGRSPHFPTALKDKFFLLTGLKRYDFKPVVQYDKKPFNEFIKVYAEAYNKPAKNALFNFEDGRVLSFAPDEKGKKIDETRFYNDVNKVMEEIKKKPASKKVTLTEKIIEPDVTLAKANNLGIEELIGEGKSNYSGSSEDRAYNVRLAAAKFHGVLIKPGEEFSFNKIIGDISVNTGYRPAYIISGGKTILGDGGGVCQVSTTAFRAALNTGLPIVERNAHAYRVSYYENDAKPGFDATIYTPNVDLRFKNDTSAHILVQTHIVPEENLLFFRFYGKKDNRVVELSDATVWDVAPPPPDRMEDDPNLPNGTVKQVDYAAWGAKSKFYYKVTKDGQVTYEKEFFSTYRPWQAVFLVGKGA